MCKSEKNVLGMILKGYPRISETFISNEILLLEKLGFSIRLFSMRRPREAFCHKSVGRIKARVDYLPETILKPLPLFLYHNFRLALKKPRRYATALRTVLRRFLRTRRFVTLKHLLQAGYLVNHLLPDSGVTHLHAHFAHSPTSVAMFASQLSGLPFSFTAHAKDIYTSDPRQLREKIALSRFVLTCTEYNRRYLMKLRAGGATPIRRVYHGIDIRLFSFRNAQKTFARLKEADSSPYQVLTIARLTPKKGLPTVLRAICALRDQGIEFEHTLIGDGDDREKILDLIRKLDLTTIVRWLGTLAHEEVLKHYCNADLFVLGCEVAANGDRDGIPNVVVESMATGVPVVATRVSAIPEIVQEGVTGLLVPEKEPRKLADAMLQLLQDTSLRQRLVSAARKRVEKDFDNRRLIREMADMLVKAGVYPEGRQNPLVRTFPMSKA